MLRTRLSDAEQAEKTGRNRFKERHSLMVRAPRVEEEGGASNEEGVPCYGFAGRLHYIRQVARIAGMRKSVKVQGDSLWLPPLLPRMLLKL